jgi:para-aminobenzoate synthetase component I
LSQVIIQAPLVSEIPYPADPAELFSHFAADKYSIFLDSALTDERLGRWSFVSADPKMIVRSKGPQITVLRNGEQEITAAGPFEFLKSLLAGSSIDGSPDLPPFYGGAAGYFGYDLSHFVERLPYHAIDDLHVPDMFLGIYDWCIALDHQNRRAQLICLPWRPGNDASSLGLAEDRRDWVTQKLGGAVPAFEEFRAASPLQSNFTKESYLEMVERVRKYIAAGDIFQANVSQRFEASVEGDAWDLYRRLRKVNPAPFAAYLNFDEVVVASASPERFLQLTNRQVETRPIKGTRPRGVTPAEDEALARELVDSSKDRAENVMIVDLLRNDIGRVCEIGTVRVPGLVELETYATVFHLVSTVAGTLKPDKDAVDLLRACWPGGSITGAPKVRAMEIIDELEPTARGVYCGSVGYIGFNGDMDTSIVIRTLVIKDGRACFQVGGGITTCSDPEEEYIETLDKGCALVRVLQGAGRD